MRRITSFVMLMSLMLLGQSCARIISSESTRLNGFPEMEVKETLQAADSSQLQRVAANRTTGKSNLKQFVLPAGMSYSTAGDVYISDNNGQTIHRWAAAQDRTNVFLAKNAVGKLEFPNAIKWTDSRIFVADNDGIKVFSADGQLERLIRTYFTIFSFVLTPRSTILINAIIRKTDAEDPLIIELDSNGKRLRGFGLRHNDAGKNGLEDRAFLAVDNGLLFAAFKYRQSVEVYDIDSGRLVRTINIKHAVLNQLPDLLLKRSSATDPSKTSNPRYIAGVQAVGDRVFVCLHLPQPEILVFDREGQPLSDFRVSTESPAIDIFGFDARAIGPNIKLAVGVLDPEWRSTVYEVNTN